jgi:hypothetical protein
VRASNHRPVGESAPLQGDTACCPTLCYRMDSHRVLEVCCQALLHVHLHFRNRWARHEKNQ